MQLRYKTGFEEAKKAWSFFWAGEILKRPLVAATVAKEEGRPHPGKDQYHDAVHGRWDEHLKVVDEWLENTHFLAEAIPYFAPDFGPDQYAAFLGGEFRNLETSSNTNWVAPIVEDWESFLPIELDLANPWLERIQAYSRKMAAHARGRYLTGVCDLHSNADALLALRGAERLCMDFLDAPELVERAMLDVRKTYSAIYDLLYEAGGMNSDTGSIGWTPFWCEGKFATIQCDFICMVNPEASRRYIIPAIEEEAAFLDRCVYHLDGPGALPHLDDILGIKDIDVVQWVSGAGQPPMHEWLDVLKKCQAAGKGLHIYGVNPEQIKALHRELDPRKVLYCVHPATVHEAEDLLHWLERHT